VLPEKLSLKLRILAALLGLRLLRDLVLVAGMALNSTTTSPACFASNECDGLFFRLASEQIVRGHSPYDDHGLAAAFQAQHGMPPPFVLPFKYPPTAFPLIALYLPGSPRMASLAFTVLGGALLILALVALARRAALPHHHLLLLAASTAAWWPVALNVRLGQTGFFIAALAIGICATYDSLPWTAGVLLGLASFKPQYALFLALIPVLDKRWNVLIYAGFSTLGLAALGTWQGSPQVWHEFWTSVLTYNPTTPVMTNWLSWVAVMAPARVETAAHFGIAVMGVGLVLTAFALNWQRRADSITRFAIVIAAATVLVPSSHPYDAVLLLVPLLAFIRREPVFLRATTICACTWVYLAVVSYHRWLLPIAAAASAILLLTRRDSAARVFSARGNLALAAGGCIRRTRDEQGDS